MVWSDNAKTFVSAGQKLIEVYGPVAPTWKYIVPRSPWWGGWWERLVRSIKSGLKKSIGKGNLTRVELETTLHEVESCINSRPLTFVGDEVTDLIPLTPARFLIGRSHMMEKERVSRDPTTPPSRADLLERLEVRGLLIDQFWSIWRSEYLRQLPQGKGPSGSSALEKGDLVLIREDNCPRMLWPMGVILDSFSGRDEVVRSYRIKTVSGEVTRPAQRLYLLEMNDSKFQMQSDEKPLKADTGEGVTDDGPTDLQTDSVTQTDPEPRVSRYGRVLKPVIKFDV